MESRNINNEVFKIDSGDEYFAVLFSCDNYSQKEYQLKYRLIRRKIEEIRLKYEIEDELLLNNKKINYTFESYCITR